MKKLREQIYFTCDECGDEIHTEEESIHGFKYQETGVDGVTVSDCWRTDKYESTHHFCEKCLGKIIGSYIYGETH